MPGAPPSSLPIRGRVGSDTGATPSESDSERRPRASANLGGAGGPGGFDPSFLFGEPSAEMGGWLRNDIDREAQEDGARRAAQATDIRERGGPGTAQAAAQGGGVRGKGGRKSRPERKRHQRE